MDVEAAARALRKESRTTGVGYPPRVEQVRLALKFMCDLGAHPEITRTTRTDAYSALLMVGGLLHSWRPVKPQITAQPSAPENEQSQVSPTGPPPERPSGWPEDDRIQCARRQPGQRGEA